MEVLSLVSNPEAACYRGQVAALSDLGVSTTTRAPPGREGDGGRSPADYLRFQRRVLREGLAGYDLVHANYGLTAPAALGQPTRPVVVTLWGSDLFGRYGRVSAACARLADAVVVMSDRMARAVPGGARVIPYGVDLDRFRPRPRTAALADVGWSPDARHVLFPYPTDREVKDYPRAGRVVELARERVARPVELHALSGVPHERMPAYTNAADALLLTSVYEGSPSTVKEAMACNTPVVSTDVGDVAERLSGVDPSTVADADRELAAGLAAAFRDGPSNGRAAVRDWSFERSAERVRGVYERVLDRA